jgi:hypothetical protein
LAYCSIQINLVTDTRRRLAAVITNAERFRLAKSLPYITAIPGFPEHLEVVDKGDDLARLPIAAASSFLPCSSATTNGLMGGRC